MSISKFFLYVAVFFFSLPSIIYGQSLTCSITINSGATYTTSRNVTLSLTAAGGQLPYEMRFRHEDGWYSSWESFNASKAATLKDSDGTRTVYFEVKDSSATPNYSALVSDTIILDRSAPTSVGITNEPPYTVGTLNTVTGTASDSTSGVWQYKFQCDDNSDFSSLHGDSGWVGTNTYTFYGLSEKKYYYRLKVRDYAGNESGWSESTESIQDNTPPTITITSPENQHQTDSHLISIGGTLFDNSGLNNVVATLNGHMFYEKLLVSENNPFVLNITTSLRQGINTIVIQAWDKSGQYSIKTLTVTYGIYTTEHFKFHFFTFTQYSSTPCYVHRVDPVGWATVRSNGQAGIPDYIYNFGQYFENVWNHIINSMGYQTPPSAYFSDGKFKVNIRELGGIYGVNYYQDQEKGSIIEVENDYAGFLPNKDTEGSQKGAMKVTAAHEFFHAVQNKYRITTFENRWWKEATATWIEDEVYDNVNDYENYLGSWFNNPEVSLNYDNPWPDDPLNIHKYGSCIFAKFLGEKFYDASIIRKIWEECVYADSLTAINNVLTQFPYGSTIGNAFKEFTIWNYNTGGTRWWNALSRKYEEGKDYPEIKIAYATNLYPTIQQDYVPINILASNYIEFRPDINIPITIPQNLTIELETPDSLWGAKILKVNRWTENPQEGEIWPLWGGSKVVNIGGLSSYYNKIIMIPSNNGIENSNSYKYTANIKAVGYNSGAVSDPLGGGGNRMPRAPSYGAPGVNINDFWGNSNGMLDAGELPNIKLTLENLGSSEINNPTAYLSSLQATYANIRTLSDTYPGSMTPRGGQLTGLNGYNIEISPDVPQNQIINFALDMYDEDGLYYYDTFNLPVGLDILPKYSFHQYSDVANVSIGQYGNADNNPTAGELSSVIISLYNQGYSNIRSHNYYRNLPPNNPNYHPNYNHNLTAVISSTSPYVKKIFQENQQFNDVLTFSYGQAIDGYRILLRSDAPLGDAIPLGLTIQDTVTDVAGQTQIYTWGDAFNVVSVGSDTIKPLIGDVVVTKEPNITILKEGQKVRFITNVLDGSDKISRAINIRYPDGSIESVDVDNHPPLWVGYYEQITDWWQLPTGVNTLQDGTYSIMNIIVDDGYGNFATKDINQNIEIDTELPTVGLQDIYVPGGFQLVNIMGTAFDVHLEKYQIYYSTGKDVPAGSSNWSFITENTVNKQNDVLYLWDISDLTEQEYTIKLVAVDMVGHTSISTADFIGDRESPIISSIAASINPGGHSHPLDTFTSNDLSVGIGFDLYDRFSSSVAVAIGFIVGPSTPAARTQIYSLIPDATGHFVYFWDGKDDYGFNAKDGVYDVTIFAEDMAGNKTEVVVLESAFKIDRTPAQVKVLYADKSIFYADESVSASYMIDEAADVGVDILDGAGRVIRSDDFGAQTADVLYTYVWDGKNYLLENVSDGVYFILIKTTDSVGNRGSGSIGVLKNNIPAKISFPSEDYSIVGGTLIVRGDALDPDAVTPMDFKYYRLWYSTSDVAQIDDPRGPEPGLWYPIKVPLINQSSSSPDYPESNTSYRAVINDILGYWDTARFGPLEAGTTCTLLLVTEDNGGHVGYDIRKVIVNGPVQSMSAPAVSIISPLENAIFHINTETATLKMEYDLTSGGGDTLIALEIIKWTGGHLGEIIRYEEFTRPFSGTVERYDYSWDGRDYRRWFAESGEYVIRLTAKDADGFGIDIKEIKFSVIQTVGLPLRIKIFQPDKSFIDIGENLNIEYTTSKTGLVNITVEELDTRQRTDLLSVVSDTGSIIWSGDRKGLYIFTLRAESTDLPVSNDNASFTIVVNGSESDVSVAEITYPSSGDITQGQTWHRWEADAVGEYYPRQEFEAEVLAHKAVNHIQKDWRTSANYTSVSNINTDGRILLSQYYDPRSKWIDTSGLQVQWLGVFADGRLFESGQNEWKSRNVFWSRRAEPGSFYLTNVRRTDSVKEYYISYQGEYAATISFRHEASKWYGWFGSWGYYPGTYPWFISGSLNGDVWVQSGYWRGGYKYYSSGQLISTTQNIEPDATYENITWNASVLSGTAIKFQIAGNNDNATWNFVGPDGTSNSYYTYSGQPVWQGHSGHRFIRWKAFLYTNDVFRTPAIQEVKIRVNHYKALALDSGNNSVWENNDGNCYYGHPIYSKPIAQLLYITDISNWSLAITSHANTNVSKFLTIEKGNWQLRGESAVKDVSWTTNRDGNLKDGKIDARAIFNSADTHNYFIIESTFPTIISSAYSPLQQYQKEEESVFWRQGGTTIDNPHTGIYAKDWNIEVRYLDGSVNNSLNVNNLLQAPANNDFNEYDGHPKDINDAFTVRLATGDVAARSFVEIRGIASGEGFKGYSLFYRQDGEGVWKTVVTATASVAANGTLGFWDVTGLNGKYNLKLVCLDESGFKEHQTDVVVGKEIKPDSEHIYVKAPYNRAFIDFYPYAVETSTIITITPRRLSDIGIKISTGTPLPIGAIYDMQPKGLKLSATSYLVARLLPEESPPEILGKITVYWVKDDSSLAPLDIRLVEKSTETLISADGKPYNTIRFPITSFSYYLAIPEIPKPIIDLVRTPINSSSVTIAGMAEPASEVEIFNGDAYLGKSKCDDSGHFSFTVRLVEGKNMLAARTIRWFNNRAHTSDLTQPVEVVVDVVPPEIKNMAISQYPFLLDGDEIEDNVRVNFVISEECNLSMTVTNLTGVVVRTISDDSGYYRAAGLTNILWNGKNDGGNIVPQGLYDFKLAATDAGGSVGTVNGALVVKYVPSPVRILLAPPDGTVTSATQFDFGWQPPNSPLSAIKDYVLQISTSDNFAQIHYEDVTESTSALLALPQGHYFWRINTIDALLNYTTSFTVYSLVTDTTPPPVPEIVAPAASACLSSVKVTFSWDAVVDWPAGIKEYRLYLARAPDFTAMVKEVVTNGTSVAMMLPEGRYYWRVDSIDKAQNHTLSQSQQFDIDITPPKIENLGVSPNPFGPLSHLESYKVVKITATVVDDNPGTWRIDIVNPAGGETIKSYSGVGANIEALWDGRDADGEILPSGSYRAVVTATDAGGAESIRSPTDLFDVPGIPDASIWTVGSGGSIAQSTITVNSNGALSVGMNSSKLGDHGTVFLRTNARVNFEGGLTIKFHMKAPHNSEGSDTYKTVFSEFYIHDKALTNNQPHNEASYVRFAVRSSGGKYHWLVQRRLTGFANPGWLFTSFPQDVLIGEGVWTINIDAQKIYVTLELADGKIYTDSGYHGLNINSAYLYYALRSEYTQYFSLESNYLETSVSPTSAGIGLDSTRPAPISLSGLAAYAPGYINLAWLAPGDDGTEGMAEEYLIKYSTIPVADDDPLEWWENAATFLWDKKPYAAGSSEDHIFAGFTPGATYYFAVRARDDVWNLSEFTTGYGQPAQIVAPNETLIHINELQTCDPASGDWFELLNDWRKPVPMSGWKFYNGGVSPASTWKWTSAVADAVPAGGFFVAENLNLLEGANVYYRIEDNFGNTIQEIKKVPATASNSSEVYSRFSYGGEIIYEVDPTPTKGIANYTTSPIKINEVLYRSGTSEPWGSATQKRYEFIEIYNASSDNTVLFGWNLRSKTKKPFFLSTQKLPAFGFASINPSSYGLKSAADADVPSMLYLNIFTGGLVNSNDTISLENESGQVVDRLTWGSVNNHYYHPDGSVALIDNPAPVVTSDGRSVGRYPDGNDTDNDGNDFVVFVATAASECASNLSPTAPANTLMQPLANTVYSGGVELSARLGSDSSAWPGDIAVFSANKDSYDPYSPHVFNLGSLGFDLKDSSAAQSVNIFLDTPDINGNTLSRKATYYFFMHTDKDVNGMRLPAPSLVRLNLYYDAVGPSRVTSLYASPGPMSLEGSVQLSWLAPGADGTIGRASEYDVRYSTTRIITSDDFNTAAQISVPKPGMSGLGEVFLATGLVGNTTYYFRMRSKGADYWSSMSNMAVSVSQKDNIPPDQITDLTASVYERLKVILNWSAPGDDGVSGEISGGAYQIKYSTDAAIPSDISQLIVISTSTNPGNLETFVITGLKNGWTYYFAIRTADDMSNFAEWSSTVAVHLNLPPDMPMSLGPEQYISGGWLKDNAFMLAFVQSDPDENDLLSYHLEISTTGAFAPAISSIISELLPQGSTGFTVIGLPDGEYFWRVKSVDNHGEFSEWAFANRGNIAFKIDTTPPEVPVILSPQDGFHTNISSFAIVWRGGDDNIDGSGTANYEVRITTSQDLSGGIYIVPSSHTVLSVELPENVYLYQIRAVDHAGNVGSWSQGSHINIDLSPPSFMSLALAPTIASLGEITICFNVSEPLISTPAVKINETDADLFAVYLSSYVYRYRVTMAEAEGHAVIKVKGTDMAGNSGSITDSFVIDYTPPASDHNFVGHTYERDNIVFIPEGTRISMAASEIWATHPVSGIKDILFSIDDLPFSPYSSPLFLSEGGHTIKYYAVDNADNAEAEHILNVTSDRTQPMTDVSIDGPQIATPHGTLITTHTLFTLVGMDNLSGVAFSEYQIGETHWTKYYRPFTLDKRPLPMMAYWDFDEENGGIVYDKAGWGDGMVHGDINRTDYAMFGRALDFVRGYIETNSPALDGDINGLTVETRLVSMDMGNAGSIVVRKGDEASDDYTLGISTAAEIYLEVKTAAGIRSISSRSLEPYEWHYIAATYDGSTAKIFVNGELASQREWDVPSPVLAGSASVFIGGAPWISEQFWFNGIMDEVALYDRAIDDNEIRERFVSGVGKYDIDGGTYTVYYRSIDNVRNVEEEKSLSVILDKSAPDITILSPQGNEIFRAPVDTVTVNFIVSDIGPSTATAYMTLILSSDESKIGTVLPVSSGEYLSASDIEPGIYNLTVEATDWAGNSSALTSQPFRVDRDTLPPQTKVNVGDPQYHAANGIFVGGDAAIYIISMDDLSYNGDASGIGVKSIRYRIDDGEYNYVPIVEQTFQGIGYTSFTLVDYTDGEHTIYYQSEDIIGNVEILKSTSIFIDNAPPVTTISAGEPRYFDGTTAFISTSTLFALSATDELSGPATIWYRIDDSSGNVYTAPFVIDVGGSHVVYYGSNDNLGNIEPLKSFAVTVDTVSPVTTVIVGTPRLGNLISAETPVIFDAYDSESSVSRTEYRINYGAWMLYTGTFTIAHIEGESIIDYRSVDRVGNVEDMKTIVLYLDNEPPLTAIDIGRPKYENTVNSITPITLSVSDGASGVQYIKYRVIASTSAGDWLLYSTTFYITGPDGNYTVEYYSVDNLGNLPDSSDSRSFILDNTPPGITQNLAAHPDKFSPNADGALDVTSLTGGISEPAYWELVIATITRAGSISGFGDIPSWLWDGKDNAGGIVADGIYTVYLSEIRDRVDNKKPDILLEEYDSLDVTKWLAGKSGVSLDSIAVENGSLNLTARAAASGTYGAVYVVSKNKFDLAKNLDVRLLMSVPVAQSSADFRNEFYLLPTQFTDKNPNDETDWIRVVSNVTTNGVYWLVQRKLAGGGVATLYTSGATSKTTGIWRIKIDGTNIAVWLDDVQVRTTSTHGLPFSKSYFYNTLRTRLAALYTVSQEFLRVAPQSCVASVLVDTQKPIISIASPVGGENFVAKLSSIAVDYAVFDTADISPEVLGYFKNLTTGATIQVVSGQSIEPLSIPAGFYTLTVEAEDWAGNRASSTTASFEIIHDIQPPRTALELVGVVHQAGDSKFVTSETLVKLTAVDDLVQVGDAIGLGVKETRYSINDSEHLTLYTSPFTLHDFTDGEHNIKYHSEDIIGNIEEVKTASLILDNTPPETSIEISNPKFMSNEKIWITTASVVTLSSDDNLSGVNYVEYRIDEGAWRIYASPFNLEESPEGLRKIEYRAYDNLLNREETKSLEAIIDVSPPATMFEVLEPKHSDGDDTFVTSKTGLVIHATDYGVIPVGIKETLYSVNASSFGVYADTFTLAGLSDGIHQMEYYAEDYLGNREAAKSAVLKIDDTAPESAWSIVDGVHRIIDGKNYVSPATRIAVTAQDPEINSVASGVKDLLFSVDNTGYESYAEPLLLDEGIRKLSHYSTDNVSNAETIKETFFYVDGTPPVTAISVGEPKFEAFGVTHISPDTPITLSTVDPAVNLVASGVDQIEYRVDSGEFIVYTATLTFPAGTHTLEYRAVDKLGNVELLKSINLTATDLFDYAAFGSGGVTLSGNAEVYGDARSNEQIKLSGNAKIVGNALAQAVTLTGNSSITGLSTQGDPSISTSVIDLAAIQSLVSNQNDNAQIPPTQKGKNPLVNGVLTLSGQDSLTLTTGTYYLAGINLSGQSKLYFNGTIRIFSVGKILVSGQAEVHSHAITDIAGVVIYSNTEQAVQISGQGELKGIIYAPSSAVLVSGQGITLSNVFAKSVNVSGGGKIVGVNYKPPPPMASLRSNDPRRANGIYDFVLRDAYVYPNPARNGIAPKIRLETGAADSVEIKIYNIAAELVGEASIDGGAYKTSGGVCYYEQAVDASRLASGVYIYYIRAIKAGFPDVTVTKKFAVIK